MSADRILVEIIGDSTSAVRASEQAAASIKGVGTAAKSASATSATAAQATAASWRKTGATMSTVGRSMTRYLTVPILAVGAAAVKMSLDFNRSMEELHTQAGASQKEVGKLSEKLLELGAKGRFSQGPKELTEALFDIESVGFRGAKAMKALKAASDLATVGHADLESTTSALVGVLKTGIKGADNMKQAIGTLNATIGAGKLHMEDLNAAIGTGFAGMARGLGINLQGLGAALAELTAQGTPAAAAATRLRMTMTLLANPTDKAKAALKGIGIGSEDLAKRMRASGSLVPALEEIQTKMKEAGLTAVQQGQLLTEAFGGAKSGGTIVQLLGQLDDLKEKQDQINRSAGTFNEKLKQTNADPAVELAKAWSAMRFEMVKLGNELLPKVVPLLKEVGGAVSGLLDDFSSLPDPMQGSLIKLLAITALAGPFLRLGGVIFNVGAAIVGWTGSLTASTVASTVSAEVNTALATSYVELSASIRAAAVAQGAFTATQSGLLVPGAAGAGVGAAEAGTVAASAAGGPAMLAAGGRMAKTMASGLARALGPAVAAIGIGNIVVSATHGDWRDAGFEAGGALAGGIAGFIVGGPFGAMVGVGLGSVLGELVSSAFSKGKTRFQQEMAAGSKRLAEDLESQRQGAEAVKQTESELHAIQARVKHSSKELANAEHELNQVRKNHGPDSIAYIEALQKEAYWFRKNGEAIDEQRKKLELLRIIKHAEGKSIGEVVHQAAVNAAIEEKHIRRLNAQEPSAERTDKIIAAGKRLAHFREEEKKAIEAATRANKAWGRSLEEQTPIQHRFGEQGRALAREISNLKQSIDETREGISKGDGIYGQAQLKREEHKLKKLEGLYEHVHKSVVTQMSLAQKGAVTAVMAMTKGVASGAISMDTAVSAGLKVLGLNVNSVLGALGIKKPVAFKLLDFAAGMAGLQRGGPIDLGAPSGDTVPAMLERGEYVLNRKAVAAVGKDQLDAINFAAAPRFAKGGGLGPEPHLVGPGILRTIGQAAIHEVYEGAKSYLAKHKPEFGGGTRGPKGVGSYMGVPMANWVVQALQFAAAHGSGNPQPTSGYRPGYDPMAPSGSEHAKTQYPGGAVDFGGMVDPASLPKKMAVVRATRGFKYPLLAPIGFRDDGHASGTGHARGGLIGRAFAHIPGFAKGGRIIEGKVSWFTGGSTAGGKNASSDAGIALNLHPGTESGWNNSTTQGWMAQSKAGHPVFAGVSIAGHAANLPIIDLGPAGFTHRAIDVTAPGVAKLGFSTSSFPTDSVGRAVIGGGAGAGADGGAPPVAKHASYAYKGGATSAGGGTYAPGHGEVQTAKLPDFGSVPDKLGEVRRELALRRTQLAQYERAARQAKDPREKKALQANVKLLRDRIAALLKQQARLVRERAHKKIAGAIAGRGELAAWVAAIESKEVAHEIADQFASQLVALEPEQLTAGYIAREGAAYGDVLSSEAGWRNTILAGEDAAAAVIADMEAQIGRIQALKAKHPEAFQKQKWRIPLLREAIATARDQSANFEGDLVNVQGVGGSHTPISPLPTEPQAGVFGGLIFDTQLAISELALKVPSAVSEANSELADLLREQLAQTRRNLALSEGETRTFGQFFSELGPGLPFLGAFAQGTRGIPIPREGLAVLHGGETVVPDPQGPAGSQLAAASVGGAPVNVQLHLSDKSGELVQLIDARVNGKIAKVDTVLGGRARRTAFAPGRA